MTSWTRWLLAPLLLQAGGSFADDPFADHVVWNIDPDTGAASYAKQAANNLTYGPFHPSSAMWGDLGLQQGSILGKPNLLDKDDTGGWSTGQFREINVVWPAWYKGTTDVAAANTVYNSNPTGAALSANGVGLKRGSQIVVEFDEAVTDDPTNPYGLDLIVHGNAFFATGKMVYKDTNMNEYTLTSYGGGGSFGASGAGGIFEERVTVSVAQSLDGPWYTYETTFGDWYFPTQPLAWDRDAINPNTGATGDWTNQENDWTKPVNPALVDLAGEAAEAGSGQWGYLGGRTVADALDLYSGSAGGTGFDLAESGFDWIKYVKFTDPDNRQGEICGVVDVAPVSTGDSLTMTWHNVHETGQSDLYFQDPGDESITLAHAAFNEIDQVSTVSVSVLDDLSAYRPVAGANLGAYLLEIDEVFPDEGTGTFNLDLSLRVSDSYLGDGSDLALLFWDGSLWEELFDTGFDPDTGMFGVSGLTAASALVITRAVPEPASWVLVSSGVVGLVLVGLRRKKRSRAA